MRLIGIAVAVIKMEHVMEIHHVVNAQKLKFMLHHHVYTLDQQEQHAHLLIQVLLQV
jgi:hypothetical protein